MKRKQHQLKSVWQGLWLCLAGFFLIGNTACNNKNEVHLNTGTSAQEETEGIAFTPILEGDLHWVGGSNGENSTRSERVVQHPDTTYCIPIDIEPLAGNIQGQDTIPQFYLHVEVNDCPTELGTTTSSTRASLYNSNTLQDFALFAYHYKGHAEDESVSVPYPLKKRIKVTKRDNWKTDLLWGKHITEESITRFCAFAPYNAPVDLKAEDGGAGDFLSFHYTVPSNPADQIDLLSADTGRKVWKNEGVHYGTPIPLAFGHILTSLSFSYQADLPNAIIDEISISNIAMSGTYNYGYDNVAGATGGYWESGRESKGSCVVKVNKEHTFSNRGSSATPHN